MTNIEFNEKVRKRTRDFAVEVIRFLSDLPFNTATKTISGQLCRCATSVGANFRAFCRGRSNNELFAKICIVVEEADETVYWLELCDAANFGDKSRIAKLSNEALEILKISAKIKSNLSPR